MLRLMGNRPVLTKSPQFDWLENTVEGGDIDRLIALRQTRTREGVVSPSFWHQKDPHNAQRTATLKPYTAGYGMVLVLQLSMAAKACY